MGANRVAGGLQSALTSPFCVRVRRACCCLESCLPRHLRLHHHQHESLEDDDDDDFELSPAHPAGEQRHASPNPNNPLLTAREKARSSMAAGDEESTSRWSTGQPTPLRALPTIAQPPKPETLSALWREHTPTVSGEDEHECVICLDNFTTDNPEMHTLCACGENRCRFHYPCLLAYIERSGSRCPACRAPLYFEEYS